MEVEFLDSSLDNLGLKETISVPISDLSAYGVIGNELLKMINDIKIPGGEGIYKVTFPDGINGTLSTFKNESAYLGSIKTENGFAQARLNKINFDPESLFMAVAVMGINFKLDAIIEMQQKILDYMYAKEEACIHGNYRILNEAISNYKFNWDKEKYINQNIHVVSAIKTDMYKTIELCKKNIKEILETPSDFHFIRSAGKLVKDLTRYNRDYYEAQFLEIYATFFEVLLLKNFSEDNLNNVKLTVDNNIQEYLSLYKDSLDWAEQYLTSSINYKAAPILHGFDKMYEKAFKKAKISIGKAYEYDSELYLSAKEQMKLLEYYKDKKLSGFSDEISRLSFIHNKGFDIYIDKDKVYLLDNVI